MTIPSHKHEQTKTIQLMLSRIDDGNDDDPASEQNVIEVGEHSLKRASRAEPKNTHPNNMPSMVASIVQKNKPRPRII